MRLKSILASLALLLPAVTATAQEVDFAGKTVRLYQNYSAGGSTDLFARAIAPYIAKYLPGHPDILVEPRPGAGGLQAAIAIHNSAEPDGLTACVCNTLPARWVTVQNFDLDLRNFGIAGSQSSNSVILLHDRLGVTTPADFGRLSQPILFAATAPTDMNANRFKVFARMLGADLKVIGGYKSAGNFVQSITGGETMSTSLNADYFVLQRDTLKESGTVQPFAQVGIPSAGGFRPDPNLGVPTLDDLLREQAPDALQTEAYHLFSAFNQAAAIQFIYILPPNTPAPIVGAWETALQKAVADPDYARDVAQMGADLRPFVDAADTRTKLGTLFDVFHDEAVLALLEEISPAYFK